MQEKRRLLGMTLNELKEVAAEAGLPGYAAKQIADWLYKKKVTSIAEMTNIAAAKRTLLEESFEVGSSSHRLYEVGRRNDKIFVCSRPW